MGGWNFAYLDVWQQESAVFSVDAESVTEILTNLTWTLDISEQYPKNSSILEVNIHEYEQKRAISGHGG